MRNDRSSQKLRFGWESTPQGWFAEMHGSSTQVRVGSTSLKKKCSLHVHKKEAPSLLEKHAPFESPLT